MNLNFLDFEQPIAELEAKIEELRYIGNDADINITDEIARLSERSQELTRTIFSSLSAHQVSRLARHPQRPYTLDYLQRLCTDFEELHGDRSYADDPAIICGIGRLDALPVAIIGNQKGRNTQENIQRNYGMAKPEGYRKALRIMKLAERFRMPLVTLIDTPGAYPGIDAEERGQSEAIARNLYEMSGLRIPIVAAVIGEGGSGGALAIGVCDRLIMLEYSTYSVISPEGCAAILWKSADKAGEAAEALGLTSARLSELGLVDQVVPEPLGGAHRDVDETASRLKTALIDAVTGLSRVPAAQLVEQRYERLMQYGRVARG